MRRLVARPGESAAPLRFSPLHGKVHLITAGIAVHDLEFRAEQAIHRLRKLRRVVPRDSAADYQIPHQQVVEISDAGRVPRRAGADFVVGAPEPIELCRVEIGASLSDRWGKYGS